MPDAYIAMGQTAENVARLRGLSRRELDEFGVRSQNLAEKAVNDGFWANEITPVVTPSGTTVSKDDGPRAGVTLEAVSDLKPVFRPDGVVTAGNCCALNDGAAAVVVMSDTKAKELALLGYFTSEIGCKQAQRYVESPGRFDPCVPYTPGQKAWAGHA